MQNKRIIYAIGVLIIIIIGFLIFNKDKAIMEPSMNNTEDTVMSDKTNLAKEYTLAEVATHNTREDCWAAVNGGVYDLTDWVPQHPGGEEAIMSLCGTDGSEAFTNQHGGQERPEFTLANFQIGVLKN